MDMYWPQQKVFFLATLALFPDKLVSKIVEPIFWWPYFEPISKAVRHDYDEDDYKHFSAMLFYYQRDGYLTYEQTPDKLFEIKSVNSKKAKNNLIAYLKKWQDGQLTDDNATKPPDVSYQQELLTRAFSLANDKHQSKPRIQPSDIFGDVSKLDYEAPFWELILSSQLLDGNVEIADINYERSSGLFYKTSQPYADIRFVSDELLKLLKRKPAMAQSAIKHKASLQLTRTGKLLLSLDGEPHFLWKYKSDKNNTYRAARALYDAKDELLARKQLNLSPASKTMLKALIANMRLTGILGELFIEYENNQVRLNRKAKPTNDQYERLLKYVNNLDTKHD